MKIGFYQVRSGDQLYKILRAHYGDAAFLRDREAVTRLILENNPAVRDPDRIYPNQIIVLPPLSPIPGHLPLRAAGGVSPAAVGSDKNALPRPLSADSRGACEMISARLNGLTPSERDFLGGFDLHKAASAGADVFFGAVKKATEEARQPIREIIQLYGNKSIGKITKGQYDYGRRVRVKTVAAKLGPLHRLINPGKRPGEVLRIDPHSVNKVAAHSKEIAKLARINKVARAGGVVLGVMNVGLTAVRVATAESDDERTVIVAEATGGALGSLATGAAAGLAIAAMATPIGWVGFVIVAGASAVGGLAAGEISRRVAENELYDDDCSKFDIWSDKAWEKLRSMAGR
ncbi:LysM peptidoglycan-binding domain-containing protein [Jiella avicenniae]|uniref:LysM peptidoglycan-binding domain-containing protein n=1 Tax=Jiella avicenniae TaxID=2907202 RepID=A0A9X1TBV3_9HYPH|nr:LysM peptidoglycan-binding domain-containing protein [Jiella avicenniae]MCE7028408.1 LysM peptidoglycan-binding domain-containing protein [Jiella avicenniae]